jgi:hypothetical protein
LYCAGQPRSAFTATELGLLVLDAAAAAAVLAEEPPAKKSKQAAGKQHSKKQHKSAAAVAGAEGGKEAAHKHKHSKHHHKHKQHSNAGADAAGKQKHKKKQAGGAVTKDSRPHYGDMTGPSEEDVWQSDDSDNVVRPTAANMIGGCMLGAVVCAAHPLEQLVGGGCLAQHGSDAVVHSANFHCTNEL